MLEKWVLLLYFGCACFIIGLGIWVIGGGMIAQGTIIPDFVWILDLFLLAGSFMGIMGGIMVMCRSPVRS